MGFESASLLEEERQEMLQLRILMVEDLPHWQTAIQTLLATVPNAAIVGCVDNYDEAIALYDKLSPSERPNVALLDYQILGGKSGLEVGKALCQRGLDDAQIVMVSSSPPEILGPHPFAYVPKSQAVERLTVVLEGIRTLLASTQTVRR